MIEKAWVASTSGPRSRRLFLNLCAATFPLGLAGCWLPSRQPAVPAGQTERATVLGVDGERFFPASSIVPLEEEFIAALQRQVVARGIASTTELPELQLLAISGGGENGAFGAGVLCGWSAAGRGSRRGGFPARGPRCDRTWRRSGVHRYRSGTP